MKEYADNKQFFTQGTSCRLDESLARAWLEQQKKLVTQQEYELLAHAQATLLANIGDPGDILEGDSCGGRGPEDAGKPLPWHPLRAIYPSTFKYRGIWNWDGAFHAMAVARWDPELAHEQLEIIMGHQLENGMFPDVIMENGRIVNDFGKPPVLPWTCMRIDQVAPDDGFLAKAYTKFKANENHWMINRGGREEGLFHYDGGNPAFESGWDNSVRWDDGCRNLWTIDLNCFMVMMYESMANIAGRLGLEQDRKLWLDKAKELGKRINDNLWDKQTGAYMERDRFTGQFSGVLSPASFMPLYVKTADKNRAERMADLAADPNKFFPGMPSVSYDNPKYRSYDFWRGPTWVNVAYFALKGLKDYGYDELADEMRKKILDWCSMDKDYLWEYYDSKSGKGLGAPQYGWTGTFVIEFILNWN